VTTYFFACSYPLALGCVVNPGNWGRIVRKYRTDGFGNAWTLFREEVFEQVRVSEFATKPSRYDGIFLCESRTNLKHFIETNGRVMDLMYEVEIVDSTATIHRGCLSQLGFAHQENLATFTTKAQAYWSANNVVNPEILVTSSIKVVQQVTG